jgi:ribosomal protein S18 acetylase RimI-like enzyme
MPWRVTSDISDFVATAGDLLRSDPVRNTVPLTVLESLLKAGLDTFGDAPPIFGWHEDSGRIDGAVLQTPPHPLLVASLPPGSAEELLRAVSQSAGASPDGASLPAESVEEFTAAWAATGGTTSVHHRMRLFRLTELEPPDVPGAARVATDSDLDLALEWTAAFGAEAGAMENTRAVADKLSYGGLTLWEDSCQRVAMASLTRQVAGVSRVGSVYTPPQLRQRGYGGAVTSAVSRQALAAGAAEVVLYTDLANPTSNALYQRLGYRPVCDRTSIGLQAAVPAHQDGGSGSTR